MAFQVFCSAAKAAVDVSARMNIPMSAVVIDQCLVLVLVMRLPPLLILRFVKN
jgi:hypothetical protein